MDLKEFMASERSHVERALGAYLAREKELSPDDPLVRRSVESLMEFTLRDGKRVRPILTIIGYLACGGGAPDSIRRASISLELIQSMLLIHDDLMDGSDMRRGGPSFHRLFGGDGRKRGDLGHSMAIIGGDLAESMAEKALASSGFPPGRCLSAIKAQSEMVRDTGYGQVLDMAIAGRKDVTEREIERLQFYKTALYTFCGPLRIGSLLAGALKGQRKALDEYAAPVGISFQIIDDLLGFYGDPKKGGPSDISDIKEGKRTFMLFDLLGSCTEAERSFVDRVVGSVNPTLEEVKMIRTLATSYGVDEMSRARARAKVDLGTSAIEGADLDPMMKGYLIQMAKDLLERA